MNRKNLLTALCSSAVVALASTGTAHASAVVTTPDFVAGNTISAAAMNTKINNVVTAVNDNNTRLTAAESGKQARVTGTCAAGTAVNSIGVGGTVTCETGLNTRLTNVETALDTGKLVGVLGGNFNNGGTNGGDSGFISIISGYTPPYNVRVMVTARCTYDGSAAGQVLSFRIATRTPATSGSVVVGGQFYHFVHTPAANIGVQNVNHDQVILTGGQSYDIGVNTWSPFPSGGSNWDYCSAVATIYKL